MQKPNNESIPRGLERRLFVSYLLAFAAVLAGFALAIHFSFVAALQGQMSARLGTLLIAGVRSVHVHGDAFTVRENVPDNALLLAGQGLQWYDAHGKLIDDEGIVPNAHVPLEAGDVFVAAGPSQTLRTRWVAIRNPANGRLLGWVLAAQEVGGTRAQAWQLDEILIVGGLLSLAASVFGSRFLQLRSVEPIRHSYERLRQFSADASHELRGPITAVKSNADAALREPDGMRAHDRERFSTISQVANQMERITNDLLMLARAEEPMTRDLFAVDLAASVENALRLYRAQFAARNITLKCDVSSGITIYGNPDQIERIFANLIENALRYTEPGGEVEIRGVHKREGTTIIVRDTGIGIAHAQLEDIFERFWRAEPARTRSSGTGLGLPIVRALARRHGGDISVTSEPGRGSEFSVTFPYRPPT